MLTRQLQIQLVNMSQSISCLTIMWKFISIFKYRYRYSKYQNLPSFERIGRNVQKVVEKIKSESMRSLNANLHVYIRFQLCNYQWECPTPNVVLVIN